MTMKMFYLKNATGPFKVETKELQEECPGYLLLNDLS